MKRLIAIAMCAIFAGCLEPQQVKVEIFTIDYHTLLTSHKTETIAQLDDKLLQMSQQAIL